MSKPTGYVEVTFSMAMLMPDGSFLHGEMADTTIAFGIQTAAPPRPPTEAETRESIRINLGRFIAVVQSALMVNGVVVLGQVDDPMTEHGRAYATGKTDPVHVVMRPIEEGRA